MVEFVDSLFSGWGRELVKKDFFVFRGMVMLGIGIGSREKGVGEANYDFCFGYFEFVGFGEVCSC